MFWERKQASMSIFASPTAVACFWASESLAMAPLGHTSPHRVQSSRQ